LRLRPRAGLLPSAIAALALAAGFAHAATPIAGHYPPGQSGIRGAATPGVGWAFTNFNRFFSNLETRDGHGAAAGDVGELRYANISMFTWSTPWKVLGMRYGALAGIPFSTGNLNPSDAETGSTSLGLGDALLTPISLYGAAPSFDYQFQFTLWSASGRFTPGGSDNRGAGFPALVYSLGGVWYPDQSRTSWSVSGVARFEQNLEQDETWIDPGDDVVFDWGAGKVVSAWSKPLDAGVSGFATWQLDDQAGGTTAADLGRYRNFGLGPEAALSVSEAVVLRLRLHWELGTRNTVQGNNAWLIANFRI
jgi:hypothetical protein